ncbi:GntR family transcriptional regulator [Clostridiaceae bacterium 35-E11]
MFKIDPRSSTPIYQQIVESVKENILKGMIEPGERMPSVREMAKMMTLNPNTVQKAYQELERQKVIVSIRGRGTFISEDYEGKKDQDKMKALRELFKKGIVEAHYIGIEKEELFKMIEDILKELEGGLES